MRFFKNSNTVFNIWRLRLAVSYCSIIKDRLALVTHKKVLLCSLVIDFCSKGSIRWVRGHIVSITLKFNALDVLQCQFELKYPLAKNSASSHLVSVSAKVANFQFVPQVILPR